MLNVGDDRSLLAQPWVGASWEGFVIEQVLGVLSSIGRHADAYWFRTSDQYELDLVLDMGREIWAFEIKLTSAPSSGDFDRLNKAAAMVKATCQFLVSKTSTVVDEGRRVSCHLEWLLAHLQQ